jgi:putative serine protease PepD
VPVAAVGDNGAVSHADDERPDPSRPENGDSGRQGPDVQAGSAGIDDPQPLHPGVSPHPSAPVPPPRGAPVQPGPHQQPFGQPPGEPWARPHPSQPYGARPMAPQPAYGYPARHGYPQGPAGTARFPGWAWPAVSLLALVVGGLAGIVAAVLVAGSLGTSGTVPVISADNGAAAPLRADNGSIAAVAARLLPSTVQIQANGGADGGATGGATGSGFVLDGNGHVVTNNHVVADATGDGQIKVVDRRGKKHAARIIGRSSVYDLAVLQVSAASTLHPAPIGSSRALRVGDTVVAIGSPLGLSSTVTSGIVSATNRPVTTGEPADASYINALQTDAAINPGNSGGPLVNIRGQVIGVNSAIATTGGAMGGESGNIGVGFAIPMEQVQVTTAQILATGKARYPVIGAGVDTRGGNGAEVLSVPAGSPAAAGGLREGDVVTEVDGSPVADGIGLIVAIRTHQPGETIDLAVRRGGRTRDVKVTLDAKVG